MPRQSSGDEDIPVSADETQSPLTVEPLSKQIRLNPGNYSLCLCHVKINLTYYTICNKYNFSWLHKTG